MYIGRATVSSTVSTSRPNHHHPLVWITVPTVTYNGGIGPLGNVLAQM